MKIAFIGIGKVGFALANQLQKHGHTIYIGNDNPNSDSVLKALKANPEFIAKNVSQAVKVSELVFLATPYHSNQQVLANLPFEGKTLIDCTNPVGAGITHALKSELSGSEMVQQLAPDASVVKAFTIYGYENFEDNSFPAYNVKPAMLIAGNSQTAKQEAAAIISQLGFECVDTGPLSQSLHLEHMTLLWVKMVRMYQNPNFVWGYMQR